MSDTRLMWVTEVHNVGGFFGGDTVTLSATPWPEGEESTLTVDEKALDNIRARHLVSAEMLLELEFTGERIDRARLVGARERAVLDAALGPAPLATTLSAPRIRAYRCDTCRLWLAGPPPTEDGVRRCRLCQQPLP